MSISSKTHPKRKAYTLLELLVVTAIIGIMASIVLVNMDANRAQKQIEAGGRDMTGVFREVQQYALTGKQFVASSTPCSFRVSWNAGSSNYTATYYYRDGNGRCALSSVIATYTLSHGVVFNNGSTVDFAVPYGTLNFAGNSVGAELGKSGRSGMVCVYQNGRIENSVDTTSCP